MKHFFLISNQLKDPEFQAAERIAEYIREKGGQCAYLRMDAFTGEYRESLLKAIPEDTECILVLGGDGTLIKAARDTMPLGIPLIGVNLGKLGYLCELEEETVFSGIDQLFFGTTMIEERMMLTGEIEREGKSLKTAAALNDIVIHRAGSLRVVSCQVSVNGQYLSSYTADGIIAATPTGSTAYSMSAGGPIVDPQANMILLTPINSHDLNNRSIVFDEAASIEIHFSMEDNERNAEIRVSFDGTEELSLLPGDRIRIRRGEKNTKILKLSKRSFLEILRRKMQSMR